MNPDVKSKIDEVRKILHPIARFDFSEAMVSGGPERICVRVNALMTISEDDILVLSAEDVATIIRSELAYSLRNIGSEGLMSESHQIRLRVENRKAQVQ
jgi:hypothetical protein